MADIYDILAGKGRGDDKFIRNVSGIPSHVNKVEKDVIDIYGFLGEMFTKQVGTGDTNPKTGLPEYDWKKNWLGARKKDKSSPHNKGHSDWLGSGGYKSSKSQGQKGMSWQHTYPDQRREELRTDATTKKGENILESDLTLEDRSDPFGQEALSGKDYQGMTPRQIAEDIFSKKYNNTRPSGYDSDEAFLVEIAGRLDKMPQFTGADPTKVGFLKTEKDIAEKGTDLAYGQDVYALRKETSKVGGAARSVYGGMGGGMRTGIAGQKAISEGFETAGETRDISQETTDLAYDKGMYGLTEAAEASWEADFSSFVDALPSASGA